MEVNPFGPDQLQVVVPEPVAVADKPRDELAQVSMPPLAAAAVTLIAETVQGPFSLNTRYSEVVPSAVVTLPVTIGQSGVADK